MSINTIIIIVLSVVMLLLATRVVPNSFYTNILELLSWPIPTYIQGETKS